MVSLLFYATHDGDSQLQPVIQKNTLTALRGNSPELGSFTLHFPRPPNVVFSSFLAAHTPHVHSVKDIIMQNMRMAKLKGNKNVQLLALAGHVTQRDQEGRELPVNFFVQQWTLELPFVVEVAFESGSFLTRGERLLGPSFVNLRDR